MLSSRPEDNPVREWVELDYVRRPSPLARRRKYLLWISWIGGLVAAAGLVGWAVAGLPQPRTTYAGGPVSTAHAMFNDQCERCHSQTFATWDRLWHHDDARRSIPDATCETCHDGPAHHESQLVTPSCVGCHREHRGQARLAEVADGHCVDCHADLQTKTGETVFDRQLRAFPDGHPEFGKWRGAPLTDPGTLKFNHKRHLEPGLLGPDRKPVKLDCTACHQADPAGRYMLPIRYDPHCKSCHPLSVQVTGTWADKGLQEAAERFGREPAPHPRPGQTAADVRDALRGRLLAFARLPGVVPAAKEKPAVELPGWLRAPPILDKELDWVNDQLRQNERVLFDHGGGCAHCHQEETVPHARQPDALPRYTLPNMPSLWFPHSRFAHDSHRMLQCLACHDKAAGSTLTSDVLLPTQTQCRQCHSPGGGARADCIECHLYHDRGKARSLNGLLTIAECTGQAAGKSAAPKP